MIKSAVQRAFPEVVKIDSPRNFNLYYKDTFFTEPDDGFSINDFMTFYIRLTAVKRRQFMQDNLHFFMPSALMQIFAKLNPIPKDKLYQKAIEKGGEERDQFVRQIFSFCYFENTTFQLPLFLYWRDCVKPEDRHRWIELLPVNARKTVLRHMPIGLFFEYLRNVSFALQQQAMIDVFEGIILQAGRFHLHAFRGWRDYYDGNLQDEISLYPSSLFTQYFPLEIQLHIIRTNIADGRYADISRLIQYFLSLPPLEARERATLLLAGCYQHEEGEAVFSSSLFARFCHYTNPSLVEKLVPFMPLDCLIAMVNIKQYYPAIVFIVERLKEMESAQREEVLHTRILKNCYDEEHFNVAKLIGWTRVLAREEATALVSLLPIPVQIAVFQKQGSLSIEALHAHMLAIGDKISTEGSNQAADIVRIQQVRMEEDKFFSKVFAFCFNRHSVFIKEKYLHWLTEAHPIERYRWEDFALRFLERPDLLLAYTKPKRAATQQTSYPQPLTFAYQGMQREGGGRVVYASQHPVYAVQAAQQPAAEQVVDLSQQFEGMQLRTDRMTYPTKGAKNRF